MQRSQMTFFISFWEAINSLPKKDQLPLFRATVAYGIFGSHNETLSSTQSALFSLIQPVLDKSRKKASNRKQTENKTESNEEENGNEGEKEKDKEKENEKDKEKENEKEKEYDKQQLENKPSFSGKHFSAFWEAYPRKIDREGAWKAWRSIAPDVKTAPQIIASLEAWKESIRWTENNGQFIPSAGNFLLKGYWRASPPAAGKNIPSGASGGLGEAELEALRKAMTMEPDEFLGLRKG